MLTFLTAKIFFATKIPSQYVLFANACGEKSVFGFPTWYQYLEQRQPIVKSVGEQVCSPHINGIDDVWLIGLAVVEILLRVAVIAAIIYIMLGGMKYVNSRGNAEKTEAAKKTVVDALIGLIIAVTATAVVTFIGGRFGG
jgi:hypothetical protein